MFFNSSKLINIKIKSEDKERLKNELFKKGNAKPVEDITQITSFLLLLGSKEDIKNFSIGFIEDILSSNNYTFLLFLIKLSGFINKL
jgi:ABC-type siderophore export system fused ATPase/permease subunit